MLSPYTHLQAVIFIKVRADFGADKAAAGLEVVVPMPREVQRVSCEYEQDVQPIGNQSWDWQEKQHRLVWKHKKVKGSTEWTLRVCAARSACEMVTLIVPCLLAQISVHEHAACVCTSWSGVSCACYRTHLDIALQCFCSDSIMLLLAGTSDPGRCLHQLNTARRWAHQLEFHRTHVLRLKAASTVPADHET